MERTIREAHHDIRINLDTPHPFTDLTGRTYNVHGLRLKYDSTTTTGRLHITVEYQDAASHVFPVETIPSWMQSLIDEHKPAELSYRLI
jgi:hypothetical protein